MSTEVVDAAAPPALVHSERRQDAPQMQDQEARVSWDDIDRAGHTTFVQVARGLVLDGGSLTLLGLAPATLLFGSAENRDGGYLTTGMFLDWWYAEFRGPSTRWVPAMLSVLDPERPPAPDLRLRLCLPRIRGTGIEYQSSRYVGEVPWTAGACVLFVDPLGQPVTPSRRVRAAPRWM